jgi:hypothetical protein
MSSIDKTLSEFVDAWNAGERPLVDDFLARVGKGERDELAEQIGVWLMVAPTPRYSGAALEDVAREPALVRALEAIEDERGALAFELPRLRKLAGISVSDLAGRVVESFGLGKGSRERAVEYLEGVETGEVSGEGLSRRLLDVIGDAVGATGERLAEAASIKPSMRTADALFYRKTGEAAGWIAEDLSVLADAAFAPAPEGEPDELDKLFYGGLDA